MEDNFISDIYNKLDRNLLILIAVPLPFFAFVYLQTQTDTYFINFPEINHAWDYLGLTLVAGLLIWQYYGFDATVREVRQLDADLDVRFQRYADATTKRYWILFLIAWICTAGILFFQNPVYSIAFAVTLVFFSLAKPMPRRIIKLLKLQGPEKKRIEALGRRKWD